MRKSDFVSIGSNIKTTAKLETRDDFNNLYVTEDDAPAYLGFGNEVEDGEEKKPKKTKKKPNAGSSEEKKSKKPKKSNARSSTVTAPADNTKVQSEPSGRTKSATPAVTPDDRPVSSNQTKTAGSKQGLRGPDNNQLKTGIKGPNNDEFKSGPRGPGDGRPLGAGRKKVSALSRLPFVGPMLGIVLVSSDAVKIMSDWIAYTQGGAVLSSQPPYITPCKNPNYDGFDDPFVDYYIDNENATFKLDYKGEGFADLVMSHNVKAFTPRVADLIYNTLPTLLTAAATTSLLLRGIGLSIAAASPAAGPGIFPVILSGLASAGIGWLASAVITRLLKRYDQWGPDASKLVSQFVMDYVVTDACSNAVYEAAQGDDPRDEEGTSSEQFANIDDFAAMSVDAVFKDILKDIQAELQDDPTKMSEFKQAFAKAKSDAKQLLAKT